MAFELSYYFEAASAFRRCLSSNNRKGAREWLGDLEGIAMHCRHPKIKARAEKTFAEAQAALLSR